MITFFQTLFSIIMDFFLLSYCSSLLTITAFSSGGPSPVVRRSTWRFRSWSSEFGVVWKELIFWPVACLAPKKEHKKMLFFYLCILLTYDVSYVLHAMVSMLYLIRICVAVIYLEGLNTLPPLVVTTEETSSKYLHPPWTKFCAELM